MSITWILVADASRARLFESTRREEPLHQLYSVDNPAGRLRGRSFTTDHPPTVHESMGFARHSIEPHTALRTRQAERFAGRLVALLDRGRTRHRFQRLVLVAPPAFLGALKAACGKPLGEIGALQHLCHGNAMLEFHQALNAQGAK